MRALIVFHGESPPKGVATHPLARFLEDGFKHCFACVLNGDYWMRLDGMHGVPDFEVVAGSEHDLAYHYASYGHTVVETARRDRPLRSPLVMNNCVGLVKAVLCIRAPLILTPYQLYRYLT